MSSANFKKFIDSSKTKNRIITPVERHLLTRPRDTSRSTTVLHPSEMVRDDWCHRASYYMLRGEEPAPEPTNRRSIKTQLVFGEGHAIHGLWQNWFWKMGTLYGVWKCNSCKESFWAVSPKECTGCQSFDLRYDEVPAISEELRISGRSDGWLVNIGDDLMLEIKSVGEGSFRWENPELFYSCDSSFDKAWKALQQPFDKHTLQVQLYLRLLEDYPSPLNPRPVPKEVVVLYQSKATQDVKEFVIPKSNDGLQKLLDAAKEIVAAVEAETPPKCNVGGDAFCAKCGVYW
jgi:hypothetical protein